MLCVLVMLLTSMKKISGKNELRKSVLVSICCFGKILGTKATWGSKALFGVYIQVATHH